MKGDSKTNFVKQYNPSTNDRVELKNGRILDVVNGCYFDAGTSIILKGGKIEAMPGLTVDDRAPVDFTIDLQGKTILPSLYNTHCHLGMAGPTMIASLREQRLIKRHRGQQLDKNMADCLAHGITHVRDAWEADLRENRALKERISKGEIPGPRILQSVAICLPGSYLLEKESLKTKLLIPGADPFKDYGGSVAIPRDATEKQIRAAVDIAIDERGADVIKIGDEATSVMTGKPIPILTTDQISIVADQARCRGVQTTMHHSSVTSFRRGLKAGVSSLAHEPWDALLTQEDVEAFKASGCMIDPTISVFYVIFSWKLARAGSNIHPELKRLSEFRENICTFAAIADEYHVSELRDIVMNGYRRLASGKPKLMGIIDMSEMIGWNAKAAKGFDNFRLLYENGVPMTTGNDTIVPCAPAMMDLELLMFDHLLKGKPDGKQLSGAEAVKIATINSARSLGLEEDFGSIETGKIADLVILDGDPLADFRLIGSRVAALFMDGAMVINNCDLKVEANGKV